MRLVTILVALLIHSVPFFRNPGGYFYFLGFHLGSKVAGGGDGECFYLGGKLGKPGEIFLMFMFTFDLGFLSY